MEDQRNPWPRLLEYSKDHGVFCHVTHDEMAFSEVLSSVWQPCLFSAMGNRCSNETKTRRNSNKFLEPLWQPWPGVSPIRRSERGESPRDEVVACGK